MSKLDYISVKGFRSLADVQKLKLNGVNVLIGANGSGKSNFVEAFAFLRALRQGNLARYVAEAGGANQLLHFGAAHTSEVTFKVSFDNEASKYEVTLAATANDGLRPVVVLATQSSALLDQFDPEDVLVADRTDGGTRFRRLDGERLGSWLEHYSLGQLWEKNELGGRPAPERQAVG